MASPPVVVRPVAVVETPELTISEYFGRVASKQDIASLAKVEVKAATEARFQTPSFQEHVICTEGAIELVYGDGQVCRIEQGKGAFLPPGLRVKWTWPGPARYTVLCMPAFAPEMSNSEEVPSEAAKAAADPSLAPVLVEKVDVVDAPGITITEHFGKVASKDATCSLAVASVRGASEEAYQAPLFDEFVICDEGSIEFVHGEGERVKIQVGEAVFLPKSLRVKWIWPEATRYTVLCLPAFSPELSGREVEEQATVAKDSASMQRLEALHAEAK
mmetsp:Transcript_2693/g.4593  ORF Transcript_2693/g.4593 Transcript_2693/m.4593 type:complete len:274 (+) Transcript_2693:48-869(+)